LNLANGPGCREHEGPDSDSAGKGAGAWFASAPYHRFKGGGTFRPYQATELSHDGTLSGFPAKGEASDGDDQEQQGC
jgi:hypothetical protein